MAQTAEAFWRDAAVAPTEPAGAGGDGEPVPISARSIARSAPEVEPNHEPMWCIDNGSGMTVMRTGAIIAKLAAGQLDPSLKVWRDGMPYWLRLDEVMELRPSELPAAGEATPRSRIRRREPSGHGARRRGARRPVPRSRNHIKTLLMCLLILLSGTAVGFVATAAVVNAMPTSAQLNTASGHTAERCRTTLLRTLETRTAAIAPHRSWLYGSRW